MSQHAGTATTKGLRPIAHHDLAGHGDGMQVMRHGDALYVAHTGTTGMGTSILDVHDPARPDLVAQWKAPPNSHTHKVQVADGLLLVNQERFPYRGAAAGPFGAGMSVYRLDDPFSPSQVAFWPSTGRGVHRIVWTGGRYAHLSAIPDGYRDRIWLVVDLSEPSEPKEAGRWWWAGQREDEAPSWPEGRRVAAHHALLAGDRAYLGYDDANLVVLDVSDMTSPRQVAHLAWEGGGATHTCLPLPSRGLVVVTDEQQHDGPRAPERTIRVVDVSDEENLRVVGVVPSPGERFAELPMRFGAHNLHENRDGSYRSERLVFATWFSAGVRVYDLADPARPDEVAHWVPEAPPGQAVPQINDLFVDEEGLVWATDRVGGGLWVLEPEPWLAALMGEARSQPLPA
ncbi:MAG: LVIVD repeat-containing protein [Acidimicrobiales bacterium]